MSQHDLPEMFFVVGAPLSGNTTLLDFLTVPKRVGWIPQRLANKPEKLHLATRARRLNWPLLGEFFLERRSEWKSVPEPARKEEFWEHYLPRFTPSEDQIYVPGPGDVSEEEVKKIREVIKEICFLQKRDRFVSTYSGFPRIRLLRSIFPEAKFIQILRDPRSVAYQMVKKNNRFKHQYWEQKDQLMGLLPEPLQARLQSLSDTPLNYCGVMVRWYHDLYKLEMGELPGEDRLEVAYSDLLSRPEITLKKVMRFSGLDMDKRFKYFLKFHDIQYSNQRTNRNLDNEEAEELALAVSSTN